MPSSTLHNQSTTGKGARAMNQHERINGERMSLEPRHEHIGEVLFEYAALLLASPPPGPQWHQLEAHLASCNECQSELDELRQILHDTYSGALEPIPPAAEPDLSFLLPLAQAAPPTPVVPAIVERAKHDALVALDAARQIVIQFTSSLVDALRQPLLAGGYRGAHYCSYEYPRPNDDAVQITIDISTSDHSRKLCRVLVCIANPAQPFDQEGSQVTLCFGTFTRSAITDHQGYAPFDDIPLDFIPQLQFTIIPQRTD
jgi:hypothetical protein